MEVALCGATGRAGSRILNELRMRGHEVQAIVRPGGSQVSRARVTTAVDDLASAARTAETIRGMDALISAYAPPAEDQDELVAVTRRLVEAVGLSGVPRLMMVGGAGTLEVAPGVTLLQSGKLPAEWEGIAKAHGKALEVLRSSSIDWTCLCPAIYFDPGERTSKFRLGTENLLFDDKGESRISMEDYAIALVDELEDPRHNRQRFSVGY